MLDIKELLVEENASLRILIERLDKTAQGVLLLVDQSQRLKRTITDGDVRRLLLQNISLDMAIKEFPEQQPIVVYEHPSLNDALEVMDYNQIDHLPIVDKTGVPKSLIHRRDISTAILLSTPHIGDYEIEYVIDAFKTNWVAPLGPNVDAFEQDIAAHVGVNYAAALSSGTAALHLALRLLNIGPGDAVFCSSLTFVASVSPVIYQGGIPVFIDSEPESWNMSPSALERALYDAARAKCLPKAVIVVNLYGQSADMDALQAICDSYHIPIVEDAAESLGATYKGKASGGFGKLGVFSFNGNKIITTSGGGALVSNDESLIKKARFLSTQAREPVPHYEHKEIGYNYRMSNVLAGIGRGQLRVLAERVNARREVFRRYQEGLADTSGVSWMPEACFGRSTRWLSVLLLDRSVSITPSQLISKLAKHNIEARNIWKPMHRQPVFSGCEYYSHKESMSVSDDLFEFGVCLPSGSNMSVSNQQKVINAVKECLK